jgi:hypothetical protein
MATRCGTGSISPQLREAVIRGDVKTFDHVMREQVKEFLPSQIETYYKAALTRPFLNADFYPTMVFDYRKATWDNGVMRVPRYTHTTFLPTQQIKNPSFRQWEKPSECSELGLDGVQAQYCNRTIPTVTFRTGLAYYDATLEESAIASPIICLDYIKTIQDFDVYFQALTQFMAELPLIHRENHFRALVYRNSRSVVLSEEFFKTFQFTGMGLPTTLGNVTPANITFQGWEALFNFLKYEQGIDGCVVRNGRQYLLMFVSQQTYHNLLRSDPYFQSNSTIAGRDIVDYWARFMPTATRLETFGPYLIVIDENVPRAHLVTDPSTGLDVFEYVDPWRIVRVEDKFGSGIGYTMEANPDWHTAPFEPILITGLNAFMRTVNDADLELWATHIPGADFAKGDPWQAALQAKTGVFQWVNTSPVLPSIFSSEPCDLDNPYGKKGGYVATIAQGIAVNNPLRSNIFLVPTQAQRCASIFTVPIDLCIPNRVAEPKCESEPMAEPECDPCANGTMIYIERTVLKANVCSDNPQITITLRRQKCFNGEVTVDYTTVPGTAVPGVDYTTTTGTLTWADGQGGTQTITVPVINNPSANQNGLSFTIQLTPGQGANIVPDCTNLLAVLEQPCFPCPGDENDDDDNARFGGGDYPLPV